jgi:hypothetical protein
MNPLLNPDASLRVQRRLMRRKSDGHFGLDVNPSTPALEAPSTRNFLGIETDN